jgi:cation diffusion facilitator CzcD-associated flavoprotein CzcO
MPGSPGLTPQVHRYYYRRNREVLVMGNDHILIIGAGFAGIGMAIRLKQAGIHDFTILERSDRVGGTWRDNTYPGVACDVPSHLYSYSFEPNPDWSRFFAPQEEILAYIERCVDKYGVRAHIRFGTSAEGGSFDETSGLWTVKTSDGGSIVARVVVSGAGHALSKPVYPDVPGRDRFEGKAMHSARWDHAYPLEGKSVAVIGTGASAIQIVPAIAEKVKQVHLFQRTPAWILPKRNGVIDAETQALFAKHPGRQRALRMGIYGITEVFGLGFTHFRPLMKLARFAALKHLEKVVRDPVLRARLTPDYPIGCKRVLFSNDFYPAMQRENVELVTDGIAEVRARSIVTKDGKERPVDVIALATGFDAADVKAPFPIHGRGGRALPDGAEAYLGTTFAGFPNFFMIIGPNTGLGHTSMVVMMEAQIGYILGALRTMRKKKLKLLDVRKSVVERYNARIQARLAKTVWNSGCRSWYQTKEGKNTTLWPGLTIEYRARMRRFDAESYEQVVERLPVS